MGGLCHTVFALDEEECVVSTVSDVDSTDMVIHSRMDRSFEGRAGRA